MCRSLRFRRVCGGAVRSARADGIVLLPKGPSSALWILYSLWGGCDDYDAAITFELQIEGHYIPNVLVVPVSPRWHVHDACFAGTKSHRGCFLTR